MKQVYILRDPTTREIRYVGSSVDPSARTYKAPKIVEWLTTLLPRLPIVEVLEETEQWSAREAYWILHLKATGSSLLNVIGISSEERCQRIAENTKKSWEKRKRTWSWSPEAR